MLLPGISVPPSRVAKLLLMCAFHEVHRSAGTYYTIEVLCDERDAASESRGLLDFFLYALSGVYGALHVCSVWSVWSLA